MLYQCQCLDKYSDNLSVEKVLNENYSSVLGGRFDSDENQMKLVRRYEQINQKIQCLSAQQRDGPSGVG